MGKQYCHLRQCSWPTDRESHSLGNWGGNQHWPTLDPDLFDLQGWFVAVIAEDGQLYRWSGVSTAPEDFQHIYDAFLELVHE